MAFDAAQILRQTYAAGAEAAQMAQSLSRPEPAAVQVHCPDGGRWVPISSGIRNCLSAVQKWLEAAHSALSRLPHDMSADASTSPSTNVEHAPYSPTKGMGNTRMP